ncbi:MAG: nucleotide exchange factor GrpE, partial [Pseudomonadota bacterium]
MNDPKSQSQQPANDAGPTPEVEASDIEDSFATGTNQDPEGQSSTPPQPETVEQAGEAALAARIDELQAEMANQRDQLLRAVAEAENGRRRAEREKEDTAKFAISKFARDMLDIS